MARNRLLPVADFDCLTEADKITIQQSWNDLKADNLSNIGSYAFLRILKTVPAVRQVFGFDGLTDDQILSNPMFKVHSMRFMRPIDLTIVNLDAMQITVIPSLIQLGAKHHNYPGFQPKYVDALGQALIDVFESMLESKLSPDDSRWTVMKRRTAHKSLHNPVMAAWSKLFRLLVSTFMRGYEAKRDVVETHKLADAYKKASNQTEEATGSQC
jgi:hypothetical protein